MGRLADQLETLLTRLEEQGRKTQSASLNSESENDLPFGLPIRPRLEVPKIALGRGWTDEQEQDYARRSQRLAGMQRTAGVPDRYKGFTWETWRGARRDDLLTWPAVPGPDGRVQWAVFAFGPRGAGKTHATTAVLSDLLCRGWECRWVEVAEALEEVKAEFSDDVHEGRTMAALKSTQVLLLDDLGAERLTDFSADIVAQVLRYRYNRERLTIINTNLDLAELDAIDARLSSRLAGKEALQINFAGRKDWRL